MHRSPLRVLTWNILRWSRPARLDALTRTLAHVDADIVLLQECDAHTAHRLGERLGYAACAPDSGDPAIDDPTHSDPCILTRLPHRDPVRIPLEEPSDAPLADALGIQIELEPDRWLEVRSIHLSHTSEAGRLGFDREYLLWDHEGASWTGPRADSVRRRLRQIPRVFGDLPELGIAAGDINCPPFGPEYRAILGHGWLDAWTAGPRLGSGHTIVEASPYTAPEAAGYRSDGSQQWPAASGPWDYTLDAQFHRGLLPLWAWTIGRGEQRPWPGATHRADPANDDWVVEDWPSDHLGIVVDYEFPWNLSR